MSTEELTCQNCNQSFKNKAGFSVHKKFCKIITFKCEWCEKEFKENVYLKKHYGLCKSKKSDSKYIDKIESLQSELVSKEEEFKNQIESLKSEFKNKLKEKEHEYKDLAKEKDYEIKNLKNQVDLLLKNPRIVTNTTNNTKNTTNNNINNNILVITDEKLKSFGEPLFENLLPSLESFAAVCAQGLKDHVRITDHSRYMIEYNKNSEHVKDKGAFQLSTDIFEAVEPEAKKLFSISEKGENSRILAKQVVGKKFRDVDEFGKHLINYCQKLKRPKRIKNLENFRSALKEKFETFGIQVFHYDASAVAGYIIQEFDQFFRNVRDEKYREVLMDDGENYEKISGEQLLSILKEILGSEEKSLKYHTSNIKSSSQYDSVRELFNRILNYENDKQLIQYINNQWTME